MNKWVNLSVNEFHKSYARAHLYKALDDINIGGLTLSFMAAAYPRELFRYLRETLGCAVEERHPGMYDYACKRFAGHDVIFEPGHMAAII